MELNEAAALLMGANDYLILTHRRPDGDTIGSAAALCRLLRACGKTAFLQKNEDFTPKFAFLYNGLVEPDNYIAKNILSVDIADVFLLPDSAAKFGDAVFLCIDHHGSNTGYAKNSVVDATRCAVGELIFDLAREMGIEITQDMATPLYVAVATDTGCFCYQNTTPQAHRLAAKCMELGVDCGELNKELFETKTRARFNVERFIYEKMEFFAGDKIALVVLMQSDINSFGAEQDDLENLASIPRKIENVECSIVLMQLGENMFKTSVRSGNIINASELCAIFGGGGHMSAAGCTIKMDKQAAAKKLIDGAMQQLASKGYSYV